MKRDRSNVVYAFARFLIQGLDIAQSVGEAQPGRAYLVRR